MGIFDWKHWLVILLVVVVVFGTKRLKHLGSDVGEAIKGFRKAMHSDEDDKPEQPSTTTTNPNAPLSRPQTFDAEHRKVEEPVVRKD
ncbi:twin-arginine translocase TatA/TatE family subunit [Pseudomonas rhizoryzae]|uniref:twin-arginine translocase TatA/TatE family subunit n=1 Tax=Pseudomonas rhizoryzae TaxID=2571129 RepID=UPI000736A8DC|nr:twin-arginine translocase TatA/TatE family subunit [Pseudomonas rhizoryzae]APQ13187.1 Sec-independent protein translocase TatA [Pseudomonas psychrotolerans]KTT05296.1 preprotein translocase subunit SecA [Pseudomonas psychrotolerans]KTT21283.1 preprotein translocase subunit SecA [Pseudomonas psychrotolerans]KTT29636.1 preprotein translocase subunit SecA [Pseudomonas psychrotolerans]KTT31551.1 preprotein translocase subunit SecA [Pseudomonas psychrotolerans]